MSEHRNIWKGALAGALAGAIGTYVMNYAHVAWSRIEDHLPLPDQQDGNGDGDDDESSSEPATVKAAEKLTDPVLDRDLTRQEKKIAGQAMHWAMGVGSGAIYGAASSAFPFAGIGLGAPFGVALWAIADEGIVPLAGLAGPPSETPPSVHAEALFSHIVYGVVTDLSRRAILEVVD